MTETRRIAIETAQRVSKMITEGFEIRGVRIYQEIESFYVSEMMKDISKLKEMVSEQFFPDYGNGISDLIHLVCEYYLTTPENIMSKSRKRELVEPRQMIHWMLKNKVIENSLTHEAIGQLTGGQTNATIIHSKKTVDNRIETDQYFRKELIRLCESLGCRAVWKGNSIHIIRNEKLAA